MVEAILVYNTRTKILADLPISHNDSPEQYKKKNIPEKSNDKTFEETKIFHWAMVPIVKKNQNAAKNQTLSLLFLKHPLI